MTAAIPDGAGRRHRSRALVLVVSVLLGAVLVGGPAEAGTPAALPAAPTAHAAFSVGTAAVHQSWGAPTSDGGSPLTGFVAWRATNATFTAGAFVANRAADELEFPWSGLTAGTTYYFRVAAINAEGPGPFSATVQVTVPAAGVPGAPTGVDGLELEHGARVWWTPPAATGGSAITGYRVRVSGGTTKLVTVGAGATSADITGLAADIDHWVYVAAVNAAGTGPWSAATNVEPFGLTQPECVGTGSDGHRVRVLYAHTGSSPDGALVGAATGAVGRIDQVLATSAAKTGGVRRVRWSTTAGQPCSLVVTPVQVPAGLSTFSAIKSAIATAGHGLGNSRYFAFVQNGASLPYDACTSDFVADDSPGQANANNTGTTYAACAITWAGGYGPLHELMHQLGAVQASAPHWGSGGHCLDDNDPMCTAPGATVVPGCTSSELLFELDCNKDDYFHTSPAPGSYLCTHWNTARSAFLTNHLDGSVPGSPTGTSATAGIGSATVSFTKPAQTGCSAITSYVVTSSPGGNQAVLDVTGSAASTFQVTVPGLTAGTAYTFRVAAVNATGAGSPSAPSNSVTPVAVPGAPSVATAVAGNAQANVSWLAPSSNGGASITGYTVTSAPGAKTCTWASGPLACTVTGLTNGTTYTFTVTATSVNGTGPPSSPSNAVTPVTVPSAPAAPSALGGDGRAIVSWVAPSSNGGTPVTGYTVVSSPGGHTCTWTSGPLACAVDGLTNGTAYTFTVRATNAVGPGPMSPASTPVVPAELEGAAFFGLSPKRLLDSRDGTGGHHTPWGPGQTRGLTVAGTGTTVPAGATAVVLNVTAVNPEAGTHLTIWPAGQPMPVASNLNVPVGAVRPNLVVVGVGAGGAVSIFNNSGKVHVLADVVGYYADDAAGARYTAISPKRLLDSRDGTGGHGTPWGAAQTRPVVVRGGSTTVPGDATAVALNVTVTGPTAPSHLTVWPAGEAMPVASNLNYQPGDTVPNLVIVKIGAGGAVNIFNNSGQVEVIADVVGYYSSAAGGGLVAVTPTRLLDSRDGIGGHVTPWGPGQTRDLQVAGGTTGIPAGATAVVVNLTGVFPTAPTHVTTWPAGQVMPVASSLNLPTGDVRPNLVIVKVGTNGRISLFNNNGTAHLLADVVAYIT
jgi:hypothetical protein